MEFDRPSTPPAGAVPTWAGPGASSEAAWPPDGFVPPAEQAAAIRTTSPGVRLIRRPGRGCRSLAPDRRGARDHPRTGGAV